MLRAQAVEALICYRASHLRLSRLSPPPVPVFTDVDLTLELEQVPSSMQNDGDGSEIKSTSIFESPSDNPDIPVCENVVEPSSIDATGKDTTGEDTTSKETPSKTTPSKNTPSDSDKKNELPDIPAPEIMANYVQPVSYNILDTPSIKPNTEKTKDVPAPIIPIPMELLDADADAATKDTKSSLITTNTNNIATTTATTAANPTAISPKSTVIESQSQHVPIPSPLKASIPTEPTVPALVKDSPTSPLCSSTMPKAQPSIKQMRMQRHAYLTLSSLNTSVSFLQISTAHLVFRSLVNAVQRGVTNPVHDQDSGSSQPHPGPSTHPEKNCQTAQSSHFAHYDYVQGDSSGGEGAVDNLREFLGTVCIRTNGLELSIVNDAPGYYVPLLSFSVPKLKFTLEGQENNTHMVLDVGMRGRLV